MAQNDNAPSNSATLGEVRDALRADLKTRGYDVASDTLGLRRELYIMGPNDLALALFEFKSSADEAVVTMYQGSWLASMPPRFAVLPAPELEESAIEMFEQMRVIPLLFDTDSTGITFRELDALLRQHLKA